MTSIEDRTQELRQDPKYAGWKDWAVTAKATCDVEGHARIVDGACVRCRTYLPTETPRNIGVVDHLEPEGQGCPHWTLDQGCPLHGETCSA